MGARYAAAAAHRHGAGRLVAHFRPSRPPRTIRVPRRPPSGTGRPRTVAAPGRPRTVAAPGGRAPSRRDAPSHPSGPLWPPRTYRAARRRSPSAAGLKRRASQQSTLAARPRPTSGVEFAHPPRRGGEVTAAARRPTPGPHRERDQRANAISDERPDEGRDQRGNAELADSHRGNRELTAAGCTTHGGGWTPTHVKPRSSPSDWSPSSGPGSPTRTVEMANSQR